MAALPSPRDAWDALNLFGLGRYRSAPPGFDSPPSPFPYLEHLSMAHEIDVIAFDCFGTVFDMADVPREEVKAYVDHVRRRDFSEYQFPESWYKLKAHPDAAEGIKRLQKLYPVFAFSNGGHKLIAEVSRANGIHWNWIYDPAEFEAYKPNLLAYRRVVEHWTLSEPEKLLIVTANPTFGDVFGAKLVGAKCHVIRQGEYPNDILELAEALTF